MGEKTSDRNYNGWANYETWVVRLWLDNEEPSYRYWTEVAREYRGEDREAYELARRLKEEIRDAVPLEEASLYSDLLYAALDEVDWDELAQSYLDELGQDEDQAETVENEPGLSLEEIERLSPEDFQALPEAERQRFLEAMDRENSPSPAEFYGHEAEVPDDDEPGTEEGEPSGLSEIGPRKRTTQQKNS